MQVQLLEPQPGTLLVADRSYSFKVLAPQWSSVAVGTQQCGWQVLQPMDTTEAGILHGSGHRVAAAADDVPVLAVFAGSVCLPRVGACLVAVQDAGQQDQAAAPPAAEQSSGDTSWEAVLGLCVLPPVSHGIIIVSGLQLCRNRHIGGSQRCHGMRKIDLYGLVMMAHH